ncbi:MAG: cytochrome c oxidase subunit II [Actinomycetota bacterium]|nr:cytochrome c oxidase subunit II [Actinomycetota bacterium]
MRRGSILQLVVIGVIAGAIAGVVAYLIPWLPEAATLEAERIGWVFWFVTIICIAIFALVTAVIVYSVIKFRVPPEDETDGPPIHGHTGLEIVWTTVPAILVTAIGVFSAIVLAQNDRLGPNPLKIDVTAQQFAWSFKYPESNGLASTELRLPVDRSIQLRIHALDVLHSFWVPQFSQKQDAVPGEITTLHITPTRVGRFPIKCMELCGLGHAAMRATAIVMPAAAFDAWASKEGQAQDGGGADAGKAIFASNSCAGCHTLKAAGATGKVGPDLDDLAAQAREAAKPLEEFIRESIVKPDAYVQKGYPPNVMPKTYASSLSSKQLDALVQYLVSASKASGA